MTSEPPKQSDDDQSGYGATEESFPPDTPPEAQPQRPEPDRSDVSPDEIREEREAEERQSGRGAV